jgi:hypothetical protein
MHRMQTEIDQDRIDQAVLALLLLGRHEGYRTWKAFDWDVMGRLHAKGYISDPVGKSNSLHGRGTEGVRASFQQIVLPGSHS